MDKLSLYEILTYVIPGFILIQLFDFYYHHILGKPSFLSEDAKFSDSILLFCISLFMGLITHIITFRLLKTQKMKWYKKLIFRTQDEFIKNNEFIQKVIPFLNQDYRQTRRHEEIKVTENKIENYLFDFAYIYLEVNDKITPAKNFQSMYFWFRNMFTISLCLIPISLAMLVFVLVKSNFINSIQIDCLLIFIINLVVCAILVPTANWIREKLIEKVLWSYYVERVHELDKIKNSPSK